MLANNEQVPYLSHTARTVRDPYIAGRHGRLTH